MTTEVVGPGGATARGQEAGTGPGTHREAGRQTVRGGIGRAQVAAVASLVALPLLLYGLPALLGHPVAPGDDLTQNLPLRELVGRDLRDGTLPIFDPYLWSGAPLLAGWNAGAAYPLTWLFAVLPGSAAWTVNLLAAGAAAGVGSYAFLRASRLGVLASWVGATTFAFGGGMIAQTSHVSLVIGMSWAPVALLALRHLTDDLPSAAGARLRWSAVLAAAVGLVLLAGEPRAVTDAAAVLVLYSAWRVLRLCAGSWKRLPTVAGGVLAGAAVGVGIGAVQLLPGLAAVATSQRAQVTNFLFGAGSLPVRWLGLFAVPNLLGGSGSFGAPTFFASYNLTEVTGYVGILPLVAALALFARLRRRAPLAEWLVWEVVAAAGVLLALGNHTPLWHLLIHLPLVGGQRLQSRAILVTDLALAFLLAYWLDGWGTDPDRSVPPAAGHPHVGGDGAMQRALGALPPLCVAGLVVADWVAGPSFSEWMGVGASAATHADALWPWLVPSFVLALGALALVIGAHRLAPAVRRPLAAIFVVVDLVVLAVTTVVAVAVPSGGAGSTGEDATPVPRPPAAAAAATAAAVARSRLRPIAALHLTGRFAVYDPGLVDGTELRTLGVPDANALSGTWSLQGYGSIVDGHYAAATGVHGVSGTGQDVFSPRAALDGTFDALATQAVLAPSQYLRTAARGGRGGRGAADAAAPGTRRLGAGGRATWLLGTPLAVRSASVSVRASAAAAQPVGAAVRVGALTAGGAVQWAQVRRARGATWDAVWSRPTVAVGIVVSSSAAAVAAPPVVTDAGGGSYVLDGVLQEGMVAPHWRYGGEDGAFAVFVDREARAPLSLRALPGGSLRDATVRRVSGPRLAPDSAFVSSPRGVDVVRAVAAIPGWTATWDPSTAAPRRLAVRRLGTVQVVRVPAGRGVLSWRYTAPELLAGAVVSAASVAVLAGLLLAAFVVGRRRRLGRI